MSRSPKRRLRCHSSCSLCPAGALGDICDRRKLILFTEIWMASVAIALAALVITGFISPWLLLALTFALSAGDAFETPTWRAVLPELVAKEDLEAASALNGIEFNLARAIGPGLAGVLIAAFGVGTAFVVNVMSFYRRDFCGGELEAATSETDGARGKSGRRDHGRVAICPLLDGSSGFNNPSRRGHVLRQRVARTLADGGA